MEVGGLWSGVRAIALASLASVATSAPAAAQTMPGGAPAGEPAESLGASAARAANPEADRTLGGHVFIPTLLVRSPFAVNALEMDLMYGSGSATGTKFSITGRERGEATYSFAAMGQTFAYEHKFAEGLSLAVGFVTQLYSGIDGPSAVVVGLEVGAGLFERLTWGGNLGPVRTAVTLDASYAPRYGILVLDAIEAALQGNRAEYEAFNETNAWTVKPGLAAAWAPWPALGLTAAVDYQWVSLETTDSGRATESGVDLALAAELDFRKFTSASIALDAGYHTTAPLGSDGVSRVIDWGGGVYYNGHPSLVAGLELGYRKFDIRDLRSSATLAQIRLQYLW
jgi:hypothetical protein